MGRTALRAGPSWPKPPSSAHSLRGMAVAALAQPTTLVVTGYGARRSGVMVQPLTEPFQKRHGVEVEIAPRRAWTEKWNRGLR